MAVEMVVVEMAVEMAVEMVAVAMVVEEMVKDAQGGKPGKAPEVGVLSTVYA